MKVTRVLNCVINWVCVINCLINKFTVKMSQKVTVIFAVRPEEKDKVCNTSIANQVPPHLWNKGPFCVIWHCRWNQKGLMPVSPVVHFCGQCVIAAGRSVLAGTVDMGAF